MGYEVDVEGEIVFLDIDGFRKGFKKIALNLTSEIGMHDDFDYFFTKMWGDKLEETIDMYNGEEIRVQREGKLWYDDEKAMKFLSKYAQGEVRFYGEDNTDWKWIIDGKGNATKEEREW